MMIAITSNKTNSAFHEWIIDMNINPDWDKWTDKEKMWFTLRFTGL